MRKMPSSWILPLVLSALLLALLLLCPQPSSVLAEGLGGEEGGGEKNPVSEFSSPEAMNAANSKMGVRTGSIQDAYTAQYLPDTSIYYYEGLSDMIVALTSGKIDGFMTVATRVPLILRENQKLAAIELEGPQDHVAFMSARTEFSRDLLVKLNAYILSIQKSGLFDELYDEWFEAEDRYPQVIATADLPGEKGTIRYVAQGNMEPISFMEGGDLTGLELDMLSRFCQAYGYGLSVTESNIAGMLAGLFVTLFYVFAHKGLFFVKGTEYLDLIGGANSFFTISPEAFGAVGAMVNFLVAYLVSKMSDPAPRHIQELVESVRVPRGAGGAAAGH